jgi:hypothetical protein
MVVTVALKLRMRIQAKISPHSPLQYSNPPKPLQTTFSLQFQSNPYGAENEAKWYT